MIRSVYFNRAGQLVFYVAWLVKRRKAATVRDKLPLGLTNSLSTSRENSSRSSTPTRESTPGPAESALSDTLPLNHGDFASFSSVEHVYPDGPFDLEHFTLGAFEQAPQALSCITKVFSAQIALVQFSGAVFDSTQVSLELRFHLSLDPGFHAIERHRDRRNQAARALPLFILCKNFAHSCPCLLFHVAP